MYSLILSTLATLAQINDREDFVNYLQKKDAGTCDSSQVIYDIFERFSATKIIKDDDVHGHTKNKNQSHVSTESIHVRKSKDKEPLRTENLKITKILFGKSLLTAVLRKRKLNIREKKKKIWTENKPIRAMNTIRKSENEIERFYMEKVYRILKLV